jgi:DNA-binding NtrC family response regulator
LPAPNPLAAAKARAQSEVEALEKTAILQALEACVGNQTRAAELLGISRRTLLKRLDEYGIRRPRKREGA